MMKNRYTRILLCSFVFFCSVEALASKPLLLFSDLISGSSTGLNDSEGSGVIVTIWGQNILSYVDGSSSVQFTDSNGDVYPAAHIYYWKNADGVLPSGPANLFASHRMQEIAFSIPSAAKNGIGSIHISSGGFDSNPLPFTVRASNIYHVKQDGNDAATGTFTDPWKTISKSLDKIDTPGATLYVHGSLETGDILKDRAIYWNNVSASSGLTNQFGIVAYPDSQPKVTAYKFAFSNYKTTGWVVSKFKTYTSNCDVDVLGQPINCNGGVSGGIKTTAYGRLIANVLTERAGGCSDAQQGAINGSVNVDTVDGTDKDKISKLKIFGNEVHDYGCNGTSKFQHTTYLTVRNLNGSNADAWEWGWNYLHDNKAKNGIHQYDQGFGSQLCGEPVGVVKIHDNVIVNQAGAGINIGIGGSSSLCTWTNSWEIFNNIIIKTGLVSDWDGIDVSTANSINSAGIAFRDGGPGGLTGPINVYNNTIINWNDDDEIAGTQSCLGILGGTRLSVIWNDNVCFTNKDKAFESVDSASKSGSNNVWYSLVSGVDANTPSWDNATIVVDPAITLSGVQVKLGFGSSVIDSGQGAVIPYDIYGNSRLIEDIGAVEYLLKPNPPGSLKIK